MTPTPTDAAVASLPRFNAYVRFDGKVHLEEEDNGSLVMWKHVATLTNPEADAGGGDSYDDGTGRIRDYSQPTTPPAVEGGTYDGCTESNCQRCLTEPYARGDMKHAGIGHYPTKPTPPGEAVSGDAADHIARLVTLGGSLPKDKKWADYLAALTAAIEALAKREGFALDVFRTAGGDVECCPNPTQEQALACLKDLRESYEELLSVADMLRPPAPTPAVEVTAWTDEQCLKFASIAFRHASRNLPMGVTLQDIRIAALTASRKGD